MPVVGLTDLNHLECGCRIELWKIMLLIAMKAREDGTFICPAHDCELHIDEDFMKQCFDFLRFLKSDEGKARFPFVFTPILKFPNI